MKVADYKNAICGFGILSHADEATVCFLPPITMNLTKPTLCKL